LLHDAQQRRREGLVFATPARPGDLMVAQRAATPAQRPGICDSLDNVAFFGNLATTPARRFGIRDTSCGSPATADPGRLRQRKGLVFATFSDSDSVLRIPRRVRPVLTRPAIRGNHHVKGQHL
jgi:hypothetical protein